MPQPKDRPNGKIQAHRVDADGEAAGVIARPAKLRVLAVPALSLEWLREPIPSRHRGPAAESEWQVYESRDVGHGQHTRREALAIGEQVAEEERVGEKASLGFGQQRR